MTLTNYLYRRALWLLAVMCITAASAHTYTLLLSILGLPEWADWDGPRKRT